VKHGDETDRGIAHALQLDVLDDVAGTDQLNAVGTMAVGAYDGMAAIVHAVQATKGTMDGEDAVKSLLGWTFNSPQGPIMIDPQTRDIVMNEYLSEVVKGPDGKLHEKVLSEIDHVKDECKGQAIGPCAPKK
jgi:branched-chain amino acid transport system substrate-binding protein